MKNITVNGIPLETILEAEQTLEVRDLRKEELASLRPQTRAHIITRRIANHSGARSGRGRVIYSKYGEA